MQEMKSEKPAGTREVEAEGPYFHKINIKLVNNYLTNRSCFPNSGRVAMMEDGPDENLGRISSL